MAWLRGAVDPAMRAPLSIAAWPFHETEVLWTLVAPEGEADHAEVVERAAADAEEARRDRAVAGRALERRGQRDALGGEPRLLEVAGHRGHRGHRAGCPRRAPPRGATAPRSRTRRGRAARRSTAASSIVSVVDSTTRRSTKFWSCRTLPGQRSRRSARIASSASRTGALPWASASSAHEVRRERLDVLAAGAQRRQPHRHDVEPVEQVLAERALRDEPLEIAVRRRDEADVDLDRLGAAETLHLALLEHAQELDLRGREMSPISSRKSVPPCASSKRPGLRAAAPVNAPFS